MRGRSGAEFKARFSKNFQVCLSLQWAQVGHIAHLWCFFPHKNKVCSDQAKVKQLDDAFSLQVFLVSRFSTSRPVQATL